MAWGGVAGLGSATSKTDGTTLVHTVTNGASVNSAIVVIVACDNTATADGDNSEVSSVTDSAGNTYTKAREFTNAQGAAGAGCTVSVWFAKVSSALTGGVSTITATFANSITAKALTARNFSINSSNVISCTNSTGAAYDNADPGSLDLTTANEERLWVRGDAKEGVVGSYTITASYNTGFSPAGTSGGADDTNISVGGEYDVATGTSNASDPTWTTSARDHASVLVALKESAGGTTHTAAASVSASGVVAAVGVALYAAGAAISAAATSLAAGVLTLAAVCLITAAATVSAAGSTGALHQGAANMATSASVAATANLTAVGAASCSAFATVSASASLDLVGAASVSGAGTVAAAGTVTVPYAAPRFFGDDDIDLMIAEVGEDITVGGVTGKAIFDETDEELLQGEMAHLLGKSIAVTVRTSTFSALQVGSAVTRIGPPAVNYTVHHRLQIGDGALTKALLARA